MPDRIFSGLASSAAVTVTVIIAAIGFFLVWRAIPALTANNVNFLTSRVWNIKVDGPEFGFGLLDLILVTVWVSLFALAIAMPLGLGIALFLTQYAKPRLSQPLAYVIDLLAAVPSIVYGFWGLLVLAPALRPVAEFFNQNLGWIFLFSTGSGNAGGGQTIFTAGIVLAVMILPIITAVSREVFVQTPKSHIEAALALGATKWEVVRMTVLPFGMSGFISGSMLGLGRALGETMALLLILQSASLSFGFSLFDAGTTIASQIASQYGEATGELQQGALIAAGLVLFVLTFLVNAAARAIISRKAKA